MKHAGVGLTIGGAVLTVIGVGVMATAETEVYNYGSYESTNGDKFVMGALATELGVGMTAGGIVLWSIGSSKRNKYMKKMKSLSFNLNPDPRQKLTLSYKF